MRDFFDLIWTMDPGTFAGILIGVAVWAHVVWAAVILGGRKRGN